MKLSNFAKVGLVLWVLVLSYGVAVADGLIPAPGGLTLPFTTTLSNAGNAFAVSNTGGTSIVGTGAGTGFGLQGIGNGSGDSVRADSSGGTGYCLQLVPNTTSAPIRIRGLNPAPSSPLGGDVYYDNVLNSLLVHNGTAWKRHVNMGAATLSSGVKTVTVESGSVGCIAATNNAVLACQCAIASTTMTITCTGGVSDTVTYVYY